MYPTDVVHIHNLLYFTTQTCLWDEIFFWSLPQQTAGVLLYANLGPQLIQFILIAVTSGLVVALLLLERKDFGDINLLDRMCHREGVTCGYHDRRLLRNLRKKISSPELLFDLSLELRIPRYSIETCIENNKGSINQATFDVVHKVWYENRMTWARIVRVGKYSNKL